VRCKSCQYVFEEGKTLFCPECGELTKDPTSMCTSKNTSNHSKSQAANPKKRELKEIIHAVKNKYKDKDISQRFNNAKKEHGQIRSFCIGKSRNSQAKNKQVIFSFL